MKTLLLAFVCMLPASAWGQLTVPEETPVGTKLIITCDVPVPEGGKLTILWDASERLDTEQVGARLFVWGLPGSYRCNAVVIPLKTIEVEGQTFDVIAGQIVRLDESFRITGTTPDPDPPDPDPDPDPSTPPFPAPGLSMLIIREMDDGNQLPPQQQAIFQSSALVGWVRDHMVKDSNGKPMARTLDDDYTASQLGNLPATLRNAYPDVVAEASGRLPWIAISDGTTGYSGPLPATIQDTMSLLNKYGG